MSQLKILCSNQYEAILTATSMAAFNRAADHHGSAMNTFKGHKLIAAFFAVSATDITKLEHFNSNHQLHDGPQGQAAVEFFSHGSLVEEAFYTNGTLTERKHFKNNKLNNSPESAPAVQKFDASGTLISAEGYKNGVKNKILSEKELEVVDQWLKDAAMIQKLTAICPKIQLAPVPLVS